MEKQIYVLLTETEVEKLTKLIEQNVIRTSKFGNDLFYNIECLEKEVKQDATILAKMAVAKSELFELPPIRPLFANILLDDIKIICDDYNQKIQTKKA